MKENTQERQECTHDPIIDTGVGYYHCPGCNTGWTYAEWEAAIQAAKNPSPAAPAYPSDTKEMGKVINSLALELPGKVWGDVNRRWQEWKKCLESPSPEVNDKK